MMKHILLPILCNFALASLSAATTTVSISAAATQSFTWSNPATTGPAWIRDAYILRVRDRYYLTGTKRVGGAPDEPGKWPGFFLWSSDDLQHSSVKRARQEPLGSVLDNFGKP